MNENPIIFTDKAIEKLKSVIAENSETPIVRVSVQGGGCSGWLNNIELISEIQDFDFEFEQDGVKIVVDEMSKQLLIGSNIDYVETLKMSGFSFENANFNRVCGCGKSFG